MLDPGIWRRVVLSWLFYFDYWVFFWHCISVLLAMFRAVMFLAWKAPWCWDIKVFLLFPNVESRAFIQAMPSSCCYRWVGGREAWSSAHQVQDQLLSHNYQALDSTWITLTLPHQWTPLALIWHFLFVYFLHQYLFFLCIHFLFTIL